MQRYKNICICQNFFVISVLPGGAPPNFHPRPADYMQVLPIILPAPKALPIMDSLRFSAYVYTLSGAYFGEGVRQNT